MSSDIQVKICGLTDARAIDASVQSGARYLGFNFFPKSPRYVTPAQAADLALRVPEGVCKVALVVDAEDATLDSIVAAMPVDMIQLHGAESPDRVAQVKARYGLPVMKAVGISDASDLAKLDLYAKVADQLLVDTKPPKGAVLPGGNGVSFDWGLVAGRRWPVPWMLAGGLTARTVADAVRQTGVRQVDLSSAVESAPGVKDPRLIQEFMEAVAAIAP